MTTEERLAWLERRRAGIGGSDIANLVGLGYKDALAVWRSKVFEPTAADAEPRGVLARGLALEPVLQEEYGRQMGVTLQPGSMIECKDRPWLLASIDSNRPEAGIVEAKTCSGFGDEWGPAGTEQVPSDYKLQVIHQCGVAGEPFADLIALDVISWEFRIYRIPADPETFDWIADVAKRFMDEFVTTKTPPPADWHLQHLPEAERRVVPVKGKQIALPADAAELFERREKLDFILKTAKARKEEVEDTILSLAGDAELATCPGWKLKRSPVAPSEVEKHTRPGYVRSHYSRVKGSHAATELAAGTVKAIGPTQL